ncbi:MAG: BrnA antitoxin family protein [Gemmatimonadota bacterium]
MSEKRAQKRSRRSERPSRGRADLRRLRNLAETEIADTSPPELANLPEDFWEDAEVVIPVPKESISIRVDSDVLAWFRKGGSGYQTRMNAVLRSYVSAMKGRAQ